MVPEVVIEPFLRISRYLRSYKHLSDKSFRILSFVSKHSTWQPIHSSRIHLLPLRVAHEGL